MLQLREASCDVRTVHGAALDRQVHRREHLFKIIDRTSRVGSEVFILLAASESVGRRSGWRTRRRRSAMRRYNGPLRSRTRWGGESEL
jgi:hypothetical protein